MARVNGEDADGVEVEIEEEVAVVRWDRLGVTPEAEVDLVAVRVIQLTMTHLHAFNVGCVATWRVTVPRNVHNHREVAMLALPEEHLVNPGIKAQEAEVEAGQSDSGD